MDIKKALGARIKDLRHKAGYTQEKFAGLIQVAPRHVSRIENGINTPSIETLDKISKVFNIELKDLFNFKYLENDEFIKASVNDIIHHLNPDEMRSAYKILNVMFR